MNRNGIRNPRASSLALLCLIAHALFVCVTHHHDNHDSLASGASISTSGSSGHSESAPETGSDANCLSCRLHGSFISDGHANSLLIETARQSLICDTARSSTYSRSATLLVFGRAPPLA